MRAERKHWTGGEGIDVNEDPQMESNDPQERNIGGLRFTHDNRNPPNRLAQAFAAVLIICLSAILLAGTGVLIAWMVGAVQ